MQGISCTFTSILEQKLIDIHSNGLADVLLIGDVNIDLNKLRDSNVKKYMNFLKSNKLSQLIKDPTRVTMSTCTRIDHIITNRDDLYVTSGTLDLGLSDHSLVYTSHKKRKSLHALSYIDCRNYRHFSNVEYH